MTRDPEGLNWHGMAPYTPYQLLTTDKIKAKYAATHPFRMNYLQEHGYLQENAMTPNGTEYTITAALMNAVEPFPIDDALAALKAEGKRLRKTQKARDAARAAAARKEAARKECFDTAKANLERIADGAGPEAVDAAKYLVDLARRAA